MIVIEDKGQKAGEHNLKHVYFESNGIYWERYALPVGDYVAGSEAVLDVISRKQKRGIEPHKMDFLGTYAICVDTKKDMQEISGNICGKSHSRFRDECILARNNGIKLYVLVENTDGIQTVNDVFRWQNPRLHRYNRVAYMHNHGKWLNISLPNAKPTSGQTLAKAMLTMQLKYGVEFQFCRPEEAGERILKLLEVE